MLDEAHRLDANGEYLDAQDNFIGDELHFGDEFFASHQGEHKNRQKLAQNNHDDLQQPPLQGVQQAPAKHHHDCRDYP